MPKKTEREIQKIEKTQEALRESIDLTKKLAKEADKLLKQHKKTLKEGEG